MNRHNAPDVFHNLVLQTPQEIRASLVHYMRQHAAHIAPYVPGDFNDYLRNMEQDGTWGDHLVLQAFANVYRLHIFVRSSDRGY